MTRCPSCNEVLAVTYAETPDGGYTMTAELVCPETWCWFFIEHGWRYAERMVTE